MKEDRSSKGRKVTHKVTVAYGLQYILNEYLKGEVVSIEKTQEASEVHKEHVQCDVLTKSGTMMVISRGSKGSSSGRCHS